MTVLAVTPSATNWSLQVASIMILCNLFSFVIGRYAIKNRGQGPSLPGTMPAILSNFGVPELLAVASFGHVLGAGMILGLRSAGAL
ncbi:photosystem I reaction center subunit PsaK [Synechococcales cyanobacterium C]|uniref:Photosystem I reaction center subunit PsaK n=1 Tax=Petrachloros mirabilis ULC683 TaxID=2781853 RepID=A0A8K2A2N2_9CYAN|nr:photosystem I reaction center subunit PsaK [Petrachloros mirabilis]NCJ08467.1 photosystem I reaction center subunit PsaK [Petrachloros mirabilis ULC683]